MEPMQVAVRIRPMVLTEVNSGCSKSIEKTEGAPQIIVCNSSQVFTFNHVFDEFDGQTTIYNGCVKPLMPKLFQGYNATILAYGQTGTGKTFTMGTDYSGEGEMGVIPRAIIEIFNIISSSDELKCDVSVSFLELYNEVLYDLLTLKDRSQSVVELRDSGTTIHIPGLTLRSVSSARQALDILKEGSLLRVTGATAMNATSSRSHAVFTVNIKIAEKKAPKSFILSKFHLVDLAGSERAKKTCATGGRFKEGVSINKGLLSLGNVISQLGDGTSSYISYRDSRLTRLLQDSLGGNSYTLMIACVSPADINQDETLCTLRYADRVKKIKNKPVVNIDPQAKLIAELKKEIQSLRLQIISSGNCPASHLELESQLSEELKKTNELTSSLKSAVYQNTVMHERTLMIETMTESTKKRILDMDNLLDTHNSSVDHGCAEFIKKLHEIVKDVKCQFVKVEKDIISHSKMESEVLKEANKQFDVETPGTIKEEYVLIQTQANLKIEEITKDLLIKQDLCDKLALNSSNLSSLSCSVPIETLKEQIKFLLNEKEVLTKQVSETDTPKRKCTSEYLDLKQKLTKLELELANAQKKLHEQEKVIKMKEQTDSKIDRLKYEIQSLKTMRVQLIHQMKRDNEKYRNWQTQNEKELGKLRLLNTKQTNQINKMEKEFSLRQAVLRRKLETAAAIKKRMEMAMNRRNITVGKKQVDFDPDKLEEYISAEIEVLESYLLAKKSLQRLLDDRKSLMIDHSGIKEQIESGNLPEKNINILTKRQFLIEENLKLQSAQIADLQQKILDSKPDDLKKHRWDAIKSVVEAKFALGYIFNYISKLKKEGINNADIISELRIELEEKIEELNDLREKLKTAEGEKQKACDELVKDYEDKIHTILSQQEGLFESSKENIGHLTPESKERILKSLTKSEKVTQKSPLKRKADSHSSFKFPSYAKVSPWLVAYENFLNNSKDNQSSSVEREEGSPPAKKVALDRPSTSRAPHIFTFDTLDTMAAEKVACDVPSEYYSPNETFTLGTQKGSETSEEKDKQIDDDVTHLNETYTVGNILPASFKSSKDMSPEATPSPSGLNDTFTLSK